MGFPTTGELAFLVQFGCKKKVISPPQEKKIENKGNNFQQTEGSWMSDFLEPSLGPPGPVIGPHAASVLWWRQRVSEWTRCAERRRGTSWRRMREASPATSTAQPPPGPDGNVNKSIWKILYAQKLKMFFFGVSLQRVRDAAEFLFSIHLYLLWTCFIVVSMSFNRWI